MRAAFATLGCKVNHYETQAMTELFAAAGYEIVPFSEPAEVYIVNTCTVTAASDHKSRQLISRAHQRNPLALIAAVGCYAQADAGTVAALPGVGLVVGTDGRKDIVSLVNQAILGDRGEHVGDLRRADFEPLSAVRDGRTRATLKIQDGCVNFCSYCIIPYVRGPLRSRPLSDVETELRALAAEGYREVVLTGIHLASYGKESGKDGLGDVIRLAGRIDGIERIRLGSLEPGFVDESFAETVKSSPKLCDQFHLSLQSGADTVLERMKRCYTAEQFSKSVALLRQATPGCAVTTDVIAGFPGETAEEHRQSMDFCRRIGFSRLHVFPYSRRPGTAAAAMTGQLEKAVKEARARELIALGGRLSAEYLEAQRGRTLSVLVERNGVGYATNYVPVKTGGEAGEIVSARIVAAEDGLLIGERM